LIFLIGITMDHDHERNNLSESDRDCKPSDCSSAHHCSVMPDRWFHFPFLQMPLRKWPQEKLFCNLLCVYPGSRGPYQEASMSVGQPLAHAGTLGNTRFAVYMCTIEAALQLLIVPH